MGFHVGLKVKHQHVINVKKNTHLLQTVLSRYETKPWNNLVVLTGRIAAVPHEAQAALSAAAAACLSWVGEVLVRVSHTLHQLRQCSTGWQSAACSRSQWKDERAEKWFSAKWRTNNISHQIDLMKKTNIGVWRRQNEWPQQDRRKQLFLWRTCDKALSC